MYIKKNSFHLDIIQKKNMSQIYGKSEGRMNDNGGLKNYLQRAYDISNTLIQNSM